MEILEKLKPLSFKHLNVVIMVIKIKGFSFIIENFQEKTNEVYSTILNLIDLTLFENMGEIVTINQDIIVAIFNKKKYLKSDEPDQLEMITSNSKIIEDQPVSPLCSKRDIFEEYHSYEIKSSLNSSHIIKDLSLNTEINIVNQNSKKMNNFALISAVKIISRFRYNKFLETKFKEKNLSFENQYLQISLDSGNIFQHMLNSDLKIETIYTSKYIKRCLFLNVYVFLI